MKLEKVNSILKKHVAAIHCSTGLTLVQRKISNALLFHAFPFLMTEEEHTITISQICKIIGYSSYNYELIKSSLRALMTTLIEWNITSEDLKSEDWSASTIISGVRLTDNYCTYSYSPQIKRLLSNPSVYGQISLVIQAQFRSSYGLALYENCVRYKGISSTKWIDYSVFRKLMGVEEEKYHIFRDFKKRVLDKAVLEVNTYADITVEYELKMEKRTVKVIRFLIEQKEKKKKLGGNLIASTYNFTDDEKKLLDELVQTFSFSDTQSTKIIHKYGCSYISEKINVVKESSSFTNNKINDLRAYLVSAIRSDFQPKLIKKNLDKNEFFPEKKSDPEDDEKLLQQEYKNYSNKKAELYFYSLNELSRQDLLKGFLKHLFLEEGGEFIVKTFHKHGLDSFMVKTKLMSYIKKTIPNSILSIQNIEEWKDNNNQKIR